MNKGQISVSSFLIRFSEKLYLKRKAFFNLSDLKSLDSSLIQFNQEYSEIPTKIPENKFDLVFGDIFFGGRIEPFLLDKEKRVRRNWNLLVRILETINRNGFLFATVEPSIYYSEQGKRYLNMLSEKGFNCNLIINAPEKLYLPRIRFTPILLGIQRNKTKNLFIAEIYNNNNSQITTNFKENKSESITNGEWRERNSFSTFQNAKTEKQINILKTQYKKYKQFKLSEVAISINSDNFKDIENSIYILRGGTKIVCKLESVTIKHQNIFQIVLDSKLVLSEYLALFYQSKLGKLILESLRPGLFTSHINKNSIENSIFPIPSIKEQKLLIDANIKLSELQEKVNNLQDELSLNSGGANNLLKQFDSVFGKLEKINSTDEILALIREGENKRIEFKQTFTKDIRTLSKNKDIKKSALKNIVAFLNSDGGTLLIGVADSGKITGIEDDFFESKDKYLLGFNNFLRSVIGAEFYQLIKPNIYNISNNKSILRIDCEPSQKPCFYGGKEFYIRTNPATNKLEGDEMLGYINERFQK